MRVGFRALAGESGLWQCVAHPLGFTLLDLFAFSWPACDSCKLTTHLTLNKHTRVRLEPQPHPFCFRPRSKAAMSMAGSVPLVGQTRKQTLSQRSAGHADIGLELEAHPPNFCRAEAARAQPKEPKDSHKKLKAGSECCGCPSSTC